MDSETERASAAETEAEAAKWLARLDRDGRIDTGSTLDELANDTPEFADWLDRNAARRVAFLQVLSVWQRTDRLAALKGLKPVNTGRRSRQLIKWGGALAACIVAAFVAYTMVQSAPSETSVESLIYKTAKGASRTIELADGSNITLNSDSQLSVALSPRERRVYLESGEAFFKVTPDQDRPFRVFAGQGEVRVLGTSFAVERRDGLTEVLVSEGIVSLSASDGTDSAATSTLTAGKAGYVSADGLLVENVGLEAIANRLLWREGRLRFDATPLSEVASEFNRYNTSRLIITDDQTARIEIGGTFPSDEVEAFARLAENGLGLTVRRRGNDIEIGSR